MKWLSLLFLALVSCGTPCGTQYYREGAQEFVIDSYHIREGKFSILALEGIEPQPIPETYLKEYQDQIDEDDVLRIALFHPTRTDLTEAVNSIGRNGGYGVEAGHYETVGEALLWTLESGLGKAWSDEAREAWAAAYGMIAQEMLKGAACAPAGDSRHAV